MGLVIGSSRWLIRRLLIGVEGLVGPAAGLVRGVLLLGDLSVSGD
jgi:hypothetical protein